jgi:hypothetical protein
MTTQNAPTRPRMSVLTGLAIAGCLALVPALATAMADVATNPIAQPNIQLSTTLPVATPGMQTYVITFGKTVKHVKAKTIRFNRLGDGTVAGVFADGVRIVGVGPISVSVATGTGSNNNNNTAQNSSSTTITPLPGGGQRTDTTNSDGSTSTTIHDPAGGKNGGSRKTTSSTDSEGNTTTTTTTEDGSDDSTTTTITTSP